MFICLVCGANESSEELVDEIFHVGEQYALVCGIPAVVCTRCGEQTFSPESDERVRLMVHGEVKGDKSVPMRVYDFAF